MHELLIEGRDRIASDGWTQYVLMDGFGRRCAVGALLGRVPFGHTADSYAAARVLGGVVRDRGFRDWTSPYVTDPEALLTYLLVEFNNWPGRTKEEVLEVYDEAIRRTAPERKLVVPAKWSESQMVG